MKVVTVAVLSFAVCAAIAVGVSQLTGCESAEGLKSLDVQPPDVTLIETNLVAFVVQITSNTSPLALPLEWSVSEPSLGYITSHSGERAVYFRNAANGDNVVTARDQFGNEGYARVRQR